MTTSHINSNDSVKVYENLYTDSYFRLLRNIKNAPEAADEFRDFIRQSDMHCFNQNMTTTSTEKIKFQLMSEYSSLIDSQSQDGLLSVVSDDINDERLLNVASENTSFSELIEIRERGINIIQIGLKSYDRTLPKVTQNASTVKNEETSSFNDKKNINFHSVSVPFKLKQSELCFKKNLPQNDNFGVMGMHNNDSLTSNSTIKNNFNSKQNYQKNTENILKRRVTETNHSSYRLPKRQNNCSTNKQESTQAFNETLKKSFVSASSMYKNPLKRVEKEEEADKNINDDFGSDIKNHPSLKNVAPKIIDIILSEIMDFSPDIKWSDIAGLSFVKSTVQEIVIWPLMRPDIFTGLRAPPKGILLFGPPGTGKTLIGKCIATESNSTFFCISASSLASKWVGESEQLVRALFAIAQLHQPAVIFIDEIDSLLSQRSDQEQDHTRKLKTEFLVQFDGAKTNAERRVLVVGATNRPHELDEAARRRFVKRLYVPLPEESARLQIINKLLSAHQHNLSGSDLKNICDKTEGYSGSDVAHLCKEAAMGPIRSLGPEQIKTVSLDQVRAIELVDFLDALKQVRASVAQEDLNYYLDWNKKFGSFAT